MSFIGRDGVPAPKLKDAAEHMSSKDMVSALQQIVEMMEQLYSVCHLVHADLSEYNILWYEKEAWFIDVILTIIMTTVTKWSPQLLRVTYMPPFLPHMIKLRLFLTFRS